MTHAFIHRLNRFDLLSGRAIMALIEATTDSVHVAARQALPVPTETGQLLVILEGWAARGRSLPSGDRQIHAFLMPGDILRHDVDGDPDSRLQAITDLEVCIIDRAVAVVLRQTFPAFDRALDGLLMAQARDTQDWITALGHRRGLARVARLLCDLALRAGGGEDDLAIALPVTRTMIAEAAGLTIVHVAKVLRALSVDGAVTLSRTGLVVHRVDKLAACAGLDDAYLTRRHFRMNRLAA